MDSSFLLTICIPTYNRDKHLDESLKYITEQYKTATDNIELIVSDNCSSDNTPCVVQKYIDQKIPINYIRNEINLGMDGNFVQCFRLAKGKYVWVLGDDDYLIDGSLNEILSILKGGTYGLVHLKMNTKKNTLPWKEFENSEKFLSNVSYWITFISANIVNTSYVPAINFEKYMGSYFTLIPLYITAALQEQKNIIIHTQVLQIGMDYSRNGGYNLFQVFVNNYLSIWKEFVSKRAISKFSYEKEKYRLFKNFLSKYIDSLLIKKELGNFKTDKGWSILFKYYKLYPYFYIKVIFLYLKNIIIKFK